MAKRYGIYRKGQCQTDRSTDRGHSGSASSIVKRGGKHVVFKRKPEAYQWIEDNSKGEEMFVRKVSKEI